MIFIRFCKKRIVKETIQFGFLKFPYSVQKLIHSQTFLFMQAFWTNLTSFHRMYLQALGGKCLWRNGCDATVVTQRLWRNGCDAVGWAVASDIRDHRFNSHCWNFFHLYESANCMEKTKMKKKGREWPFFKTKPSSSRCLKIISLKTWNWYFHNGF